MSSIRGLSAVLFCILGLAATIASAKPDDKVHRIVVMIDRDTRGFTYTVNSEKVQDLLLTLSKRKGGPEAEVILLVHNKVTLAMVNNVIGIMSKAGIVAPPRVFVFDSYKNAKTKFHLRS